MDFSFMSFQVPNVQTIPNAKNALEHYQAARNSLQSMRPFPPPAGGPGPRCVGGRAEREGGHGRRPRGRRAAVTESARACSYY